MTAEAMVAAGARPVLAGRDRAALTALAERLGGGVETQVADVDRPESVRALVQEGDVLVSTVGPFVTRGEVALRAAIDAGAHYIDSCAESPFIRRVFEEFGPQAERRRSALVTSIGFQFTPGNLAGALALRDAGDRAARIDVGYFLRGPVSAG